MVITTNYSSRNRSGIELQMLLFNIYIVAMKPETKDKMISKTEFTYLMYGLIGKYFMDNGCVVVL